MGNLQYDINGRTMKINVWNREYLFDGTVFPTSIKIANEEILYAPIRLNALFNGVEGTWTNHHMLCTAADEESVSFSTGAQAENVIVNADMKAEDDGFIKINFRIMNFWGFAKNHENIPRLNGLTIDIPLKKQYSYLMHYWPNCESGVNVSGKVISSYEVPVGNTAVGFKPCIWAGWEYGGLNLCCEDDRAFEVQDKAHCMVFENHDEYVNVHITLLDDMPLEWQGRADQWGDNLKPIMFTFGLQATPIKKFDYNHLKDWRVLQSNFDDLKQLSEEYGPAKIVRDENSILEKIADCGVTCLALHERWSAIQNYGFSADEVYFKRLIDDCHRLGLKVMLYFGYELSSLYPDFNEYYDKYVNKNLNGNSVGGWQRYPIQRAYTVCYHSDYSEVMRNRVVRALEEYGVDAIFTDGLCIPWECTNEAHGCGYRDKDGVLHETYPIFAVREHAKKLYHEIKKHGAHHDTHQSACYLPATVGFSDSYYDGENLQNMLKSDIKQMKMATFRAEFTGINMGLPCNLISYNEGEYTIRRTAGLSFIHNVFPRGRTISEIEFMSRVWELIDEYCLEYENWHPYWEQQEVVTPKLCYASYYDVSDGVVIAAVNQDEGNENIEFIFQQEYHEIENLLDGGIYKIVNNRVSVPASFLDLQLYKVRK